MMTIAEICRTMDISPAVAERALANLIARGLVKEVTIKAARKQTDDEGDGQDHGA